MLGHRGPSPAALPRLALPLGGGIAWRASPQGLALPPPDPHPPSPSAAIWVAASPAWVRASLTSRSTHSHVGFWLLFLVGAEWPAGETFSVSHWEVSIKAGPESWQSLGAVNGGDRQPGDGI